jgi:hypothetical protein
MACGVNGTSATRPAPIAVAGGATPGSGTGGAGATGGASNLPTTSAQPAREGPAVAALGGAAVLAAAAVLRRRGATKSGAQEPATKA